MPDKKVILIIDDDPDILSSITAVLEGGGYTSITALSSSEGIQTALSRKPDLILCDMMMERIDAGCTVAGELRKANLTLPIFLLSSIGNATASNVEIGDLGFSGVFQKPVNPDHMLSAIGRALNA